MKFPFPQKEKKLSKNLLHSNHTSWAFSDAKYKAQGSHEAPKCVWPVPRQGSSPGLWCIPNDPYSGDGCQQKAFTGLQESIWCNLTAGSTFFFRKRHVLKSSYKIKVFFYPSYDQIPLVLMVDFSFPWKIHPFDFLPQKISHTQFPISCGCLWVLGEYHWKELFFVLVLLCMLILFLMLSSSLIIFVSFFPPKHHFLHQEMVLPGLCLKHLSTPVSVLGSLCLPPLCHADSPTRIKLSKAAAEPMCLDPAGGQLCWM